MYTTKQQGAIDGARKCREIAGRIQDLYTEVSIFQQQYTENAYDAVWRELPTAPWNPDGSLGTPDPAPVMTNPIVTGDIFRPENDLLGQLYIFNDFHAFMTNGAVAAQDRLGLVSKFIG